MRKLMISACLLGTVTLLVGVSGCKKASEPVSEPSGNPFVGTWVIDYDRSLAEAANSPKYTPADAEKMPAIIQKLMERMKIQISDTEIVYIMGDRRQALAYTVISQDGDGLVAEAQAGDEKASVTFTLIDGKYMNFKSSASDDMDYYIWKPAEQVNGSSN